MKSMNLEDVRFPEMIQDPYMTCKFIERKGIAIDEVTLGNVHDCIEEAVDDHQLPITQVCQQDTIEGYIIGV